MLKVAYSKIYNHPLPENHRFPMEKYDLIPKKLIAEKTFSKDNFFEPGILNKEDVLNPETGDEKWIFDPEGDPAGRPLKTCRGLSSWKDSTKSQSDVCYHRIVGVTMDVELFSIDGKTGKLCDDFV